MKDQNTPSISTSIAGSKFNRRKFLAAAGMSALAFPFIKPTALFSQSAPATSDPNSPNPWLMRGCNADTIQNMVDANIPVTGVRHYCQANGVPSAWPAPPATSPAIPNIADVSMCVSIYPLVNKLLKQGQYANTAGYDNELHSFMSMAKQREMLAPWHEASNIGCDGAPGKIDGDGVKITGDVARAMQVYLYNFAKTGNGGTPPTATQVQNPLYKCVVGAIDIGHWDSAVPWMAPGLDFYGIDLYEANFSDPTVPLNGWEEQVVTLGHGAPGATVSVCECNCRPDREADRPAYFQAAANWLWNQTNRNARSFLTFWNGPGNIGGPWDPKDCVTIVELRKIGNQDYSPAPTTGTC